MDWPLDEGRKRRDASCVEMKKGSRARERENGGVAKQGTDTQIWVREKVCRTASGCSGRSDRSSDLVGSDPWARRCDFGNILVATTYALKPFAAYPAESVRCPHPAKLSAMVVYSRHGVASPIRMVKVVRDGTRSENALDCYPDYRRWLSPSIPGWLAGGSTTFLRTAAQARGLRTSRPIGVTFASSCRSTGGPGTMLEQFLAEACMRRLTPST